MPHPNEFLKLGSSAKSLEPVIAALCQKHKPEDAAAILLDFARGILLETWGRELTGESFVQLALGLKGPEGPEPEIVTVARETKVRSFILAKKVGDRLAAELFTCVATDLLRPILGKKGSVDYYLKLAADLELEPDPEPNPPAAAA